MLNLALSPTHSDEVQCSSKESDSPFLEHLPLQRTFSIVARNSRSNDTSKSTVDNLFVTPKNVFDYLVPYMERDDKYYSNFLANIFSHNITTQVVNSDDFTDYITKVMAATHSATEQEDVVFDYISALEAALSTSSLKPFSDVFVVVDAETKDTLESSQILERISNTRSRIFFLLVKTYVTSFDNATYEKFNELATKSGGVAFRLDDYSGVQAFFEQYFNNIIGGDIVSYQSFQTIDMLRLYSEPFFLNANASYTVLLTNANDSSSVTKAVLYSNSGAGDVLCAPSPIGSDLVILTCPSVPAAGSYTLRTFFSHEGTNTTGRIFLMERRFSVTTSVALSTEKGADVGHNGFLSFNQPNYIVIHGNGSDPSEKHTVTLRRSNGTKILEKSAESRSGCLFPYIVDYAWWCNEKNQIYQVQVNSTFGTTTITRTQIFTCIGVGASDCIHGIYVDTKCRCDVGWQGTLCEWRICQNGGTILQANICQCVDGYTGVFCEISKLNCTSSPPSPYLANEVASLILVIERTSQELNFTRTSLSKLQGNQIVVIYYGGGQDPKLVLSTTDATLLNSLESFGGNQSDAEPPYDAIALGLKNQLTARSVVVLVSRGGPFPAVDQDTVNQLSLHRAELRVFSEEVSTDITTLAMLGNGIPFYGNRSDFEKIYFPKYIVPIASKATSLSSPILNVLASDFSCNASIVVPEEHFSAIQLTLLVHLEGNMEVTVKQGNAQTPMNGTENESKIRNFRISSDKETIITISGQGNCSYSVEILNYYKIGYAFQQDNVNEDGFLGPVPGVNYVSLYAANSRLGETTERPYIQMRALHRNGTLGDLNLIPTTVKQQGCIYQYYASMVCTNDIYGYQARIFSYSPANGIRQQQIAMACLALESCSNNGVLGNGVCKCNNEWTGVDCRLPRCMNNGTREGYVCVCPPKYSGAHCEEPAPAPTTVTPSEPTSAPTKTPLISTTLMSSATTESISTSSSERSSTSIATESSPPSTSSRSSTTSFSGQPVTSSAAEHSTSLTSTTRPPPSIGSKRGFVFIMDSVGLDDTAFNSSIDAVKEFVTLFNINELRIMVIDNAIASRLNTNFLSYDSNRDFNAILDSIFPRRSSSKDIVLDEVFSTILGHSGSLEESSYNYIYYVTQSGGKLNNTSLLDTLRTSSWMYQISCIGVSAYKQNLTANVLSDLEAIAPTKTADDWYNAMLEMSNVAQPLDNPLPSEPPRPACAGSQFSIFLALDLSPGIELYKSTMLEVLQLFPSAFNLGYDISSTNGGCDVADQVVKDYKGSTRISGWTYYDEYLGVNLPTFCLSNLASVMSSVSGDEGDGDPVFEGPRGFISLFSTILSNQCLCSRYNDASTKKVVIWMPIKSHTSEAYKSFFVYPYEHYVLPFGHELNDDDFFYGLSTNNGTFDGALPTTGLSAKTIVHTLWEKLCQSTSTTPNGR